MSGTVQDLPADLNSFRWEAPDFTFFDIASGRIVLNTDSDGTPLDFAFAGITIPADSGISGPDYAGVVIMDIPFEDLTQAPEQNYNTDTERIFSIPMEFYNRWRQCRYFKLP